MLVSGHALDEAEEGSERTVDEGARLAILVYGYLVVYRVLKFVEKSYMKFEGLTCWNCRVTASGATEACGYFICTHAGIMRSQLTKWQPFMS
jgi:hypothetical protein